MAKTYEAQDQWGATWIAREGDPAFALLASLPRGFARVLPRSTFQTGIIESGIVERTAERVERLARYYDEDDDGTVREAFNRTVALHTALAFLVSKEPPTP